MRYIVLMLAMLLSTSAYAQKITALTENTTPVSSDILVMVDDPSGTPATRKATISNVVGLVNDGSVTVGDGTTTPFTMTFDADAGTDGTLVYDGTADAFEINKTLGIGVGTINVVDGLQIGDAFDTSISGNTLLGVGNASASTQFQIGQDENTNMFMQWVYNATDSAAYLNLQTWGNDNDIRLGPVSGDGGIIILKDTSGGYIGIGDLTPDAMLEVVDSGVDILNLSSSDSGDGDYMTVTTTGTTGIGTSSPDGKLHVQSTSASLTVTSNNDLVVEGTGTTGMTIAARDIDQSSLVFGSPSDLSGSSLDWSYNNSLLRLRTDKVGAELSLSSGNNLEAVRLDSSGNVGIGDSTPTSTLTVVSSGTLSIPNAAAVDVAAAGEIGTDSTDDQFQYYSTAKRALAYTDTKCATVESLAAADDDMYFWSSGDNVTLLNGWCHCSGTCTTEADITLEARQIGTASTVDAVTGTIDCEDEVTGDTKTALSGVGATVDALDIIRFNVTNTPSPDATDTYQLCVEYSVDPT